MRPRRRRHLHAGFLHTDWYASYFCHIYEAILRARYHQPEWNQVNLLNGVSRALQHCSITWTECITPRWYRQHVIFTGYLIDRCGNQTLLPQNDPAATQLTRSTQTRSDSSSVVTNTEGTRVDVLFVPVSTELASHIPIYLHSPPPLPSMTPLSLCFAPEYKNFWLKVKQ